MKLWPGRGERLKGYNVALEVFDRPETFDPILDPIVRIEAARLREKLREYYGADGQGDPIRIDLPKGSLHPAHRVSTACNTWSSTRPTGCDNSRSTPGSLSGSCPISAPPSQDVFRIPGSLHNCSFACAACRLRRLEVVDSIDTVIRKSFNRGLAVREHWKRSQVGSLCRRGYRGHRYGPLSLQGPVCRRSEFD